jgi:dipeptidyl aminopeptidase/acylaminoacyl peptidase
MRRYSLGFGHAALAALLAAQSACHAGAQSTPPPPRVVTGSLANGDVSLSYVLERPPGPGPFPAVVLGHGSGETRKEHASFFAAQWLSRGFAALRYDKRGVGESTGTYSTVGVGNSERMFAALAGDMAAGVAHLRSLPDIDAKRIGLMGPSQAGWIIPVAARLARPQFMVIVVGPTVTVGEEIYFSRFAEGTTTPLGELSDVLKTFKGPHGFDPRPVLEEVTTPGLWLLGGADRSIPTPDTIAILDALIAKGRPFSKVVFPDADHSMRGANMWPEIDRWLESTRLRTNR